MAKRKIKKAGALTLSLVQRTKLKQIENEDGERKAKTQAVAVIKKAKTKALRAVKKVEKDAYTFVPDVMLAVAIDYKHQRIMVKTVGGEEPGPETLAKIESAAKRELLIGRMKRGWGLGRDCSHPRMRRKRMRYCTGTDAGTFVLRMAEFCTGCGQIMSHIEEPKFTATLAERIAVQMQAEFPNIIRRSNGA